MNVVKKIGTYMVATICPLGTGFLSPDLYEVMSLIRPERYGLYVNKLPIKYAMAHLRMLRYNKGIVGNLRGEYQGGVGLGLDGSYAYA